jgi:hypothetical protein
MLRKNTFAIENQVGTLKDKIEENDQEKAGGE